MKRNKLGTTTYFYKSLDELAFFFDIKPEDYIFTLHATSEAQVLFPNVRLIENFENLSTNQLSKSNEDFLVKAINDSTSFWSFHPLENIDTLKRLGKNVLFNSNKLYHFFDNKLLHSQHFKEQSEYLKNNISEKEEILKTQYSLGGQLDSLVKNLNTDCVISSQYSSGGSGVKLLRNLGALNDLNIHQSKIYKVEKYREDIQSINQSGIIFEDDSLLLGLTQQIIKQVGTNIKYAGSKVLNLDDLDLERKVSALSYEISKILRKHGYLGAFGCDYFIMGGDVFFAEINPRYQGSLMFLEKVYSDFSLFNLNFRAHTGAKLVDTFPQHKYADSPLFIKNNSRFNTSHYARYFDGDSTTGGIASNGYHFDFKL